MPINDVCILYQKSPDKVVDIVKQVSSKIIYFINFGYSL